jgi:predicted RNA methylase
MNKYLVFHDYGLEGWKVYAEAASVLEAVEARELDIKNGGGTSIIVEVLDLYDAYRAAGYERDRKASEAAKAVPA